MSGLKLPRLISDGMVLQREKKIHIWGWNEPGSKITVQFKNEIYKTDTDKKGDFEVWLDPCSYGGPYELVISDDKNEHITVKDVLVGEVWLCSGQSNMELPMSRVKDKYPDELINCDYPFVREFKIKENINFMMPLEEPETGCWRAPSKEYISEFSATAYFFARELNALTGIPVGFIDLSLGGSLIHCWMSREMLAGYDIKLKEADKYADDDFRNSVYETNVSEPQKWHKEIDEKDEGLKEHWESEDTDDGLWKEVELPAFFKDTEIGNTLGCIYLRKSFDIPSEMVGKEAYLWLGTMVDSDRTYVNGEFVGNTEYQYPPRKYSVRKGLLHEGKNNVTVRLKAEYYLEYSDEERSAARFTPGKEFKIFNDDNFVDLSGLWKYKIGAVADREAPRQDFVSWKAMGLYNAMTAPCHKYPIGGINWYQGESDCVNTEEYTDLFVRMIEGYRKEWKDPDIRVNVVQLPNFVIDNAKDDDSWYKMREVLRRLKDHVSDCKSIVTIDLGEDNDLHPQGKKELGRRLALMTAHYCWDNNIECFGPEIKKIMCSVNNDEAEIIISMDHTGEKLLVREANGKGSDGVVKDFEVIDEAGNCLPAQVKVHKDRIILVINGLKYSVKEIRYCYSFTNKGALIYNSDGLPMSPGLYNV
ncbi:MAG: sialate O-acetylesterase [Lachnospiraceae bacterium]|nr:sialate O-acetylesterase [Lachnospiraceae bacterium]